MPMVDGPVELGRRKWRPVHRALGSLVFLAALVSGVAGEPAAPTPLAASDSAQAALPDSAPSPADVAGVTDSTAAEPYVAQEVPHPLPFQVGEKLKFSIQYGPIKAGTSTLEVEAVENVGDHECYRFVSATQSLSVFSAFYKVKDKIVSLADVRYLLTRRTSKTLREGGYKLDQEIEWNQEEKRVRYKNGDDVELPAGARDVLAAMYYTRTLPLKVGDAIRMPTHDNKKSYPIVIEVQGEDTVETPLGKFNCWVVEPKLETPGLFNRTGSLKVWLTKDEARIPVLMQSEVKVGAISAVLIERKRGSGGPEPGRPGVE
ncbi:MAG TPA: DUF3108 domain-containing protein [Candidatus Udaeobacter sp.]|nr:DUF3108 domain-containing protein [Candidatus Udaeobacter sp.]